MKIAVIGKVNPGLTYDEWVSKFQTKVDVAFVSRFNITAGNNNLNLYVARYANENNINVVRFSTSFDAGCRDYSRLLRNIAMVEDSDLIVGFIPNGTAKETCLYTPAYKHGKRVIVIKY